MGDKWEGRGLRRHIAGSMMMMGALLCALLAQPAGAGAALNGRAAAARALAAATEGRGYSLTPSSTLPYTPCPTGGRVIECNIVVDPPAIKTAAGYRSPRRRAAA